MTLVLQPTFLAPVAFLAAFLLAYYTRRWLCGWRERRRERAALRRQAALRRYHELRQRPPDAAPPSD